MRESIRTRLERKRRCEDDPFYQEVTLRHCAANVVDWVNDWIWTYDPRQIGPDETPFMPMVLWPRQTELLYWLDEQFQARSEFVVEKSRDVGLTFLCGAFALHKWLFIQGCKTSFGSRKESNVDALDNPDSIFEKMRFMLGYLPDWMLPDGFSLTKHCSHMKILNPRNRNVIIGEGGDNIGRGGRSTLYFVDEAAFVERAERAEAALLASADCKGWISSVNGPNNLFARKRHGGVAPVFTFHWRDDPRKSEAWARQKRATTEAHIWASEYELDYNASVEGTCIQGQWIDAAIRLALSHGSARGSGRPVAGMDVGGSGRAQSVITVRRGPVVYPQRVIPSDSISGAHEALDHARSLGATSLNYDAPGVGHGVASVFSRYNDEDRNEEPWCYGVNTGVRPSTMVWPDDLTSEQKFMNVRAEIWWIMRQRFIRSYERLLWDEGDETNGVDHPIEDCFLLFGEQSDLTKLKTQLSSPRAIRRESGKIALEGKDAMARRGVRELDYADSLALTCCDTEPVEFTDQTASVHGRLTTVDVVW